MIVYWLMLAAGLILLAIVIWLSDRRKRTFGGTLIVGRPRKRKE